MTFEESFGLTLTSVMEALNNAGIQCEMTSNECRMRMNQDKPCVGCPSYIGCLAAVVLTHIMVYTNRRLPNAATSAIAAAAMLIEIVESVKGKEIEDPYGLDEIVRKVHEENKKKRSKGDGGRDKMRGR